MIEQVEGGNKWNEPVFVRRDDTTNLWVRLIEWNERLGGLSIQFSNGDHSVLVNVDDWQTIVGAVNREIERLR